MLVLLQKILIKIFPALFQLKSKDYDFTKLRSSRENVNFGKYVVVRPVSILSNVEIGDYSYISDNSTVSYTTIGKFCSIGPNFLSGWGIHPINGISTAPMFYSLNNKPNGITLSSIDKIEERKKIIIGNDVFIGANVTVLDGVKIGDGAIIGSGAIVSKDIPAYAIAVGSPIEIKRYRFTEEQIEKLKRIEWWHFSEDKLKNVEELFFDINKFIEIHLK